MEIDEVISIIELPGRFFQSERDSVSPPWDISPNEYLKFAQKDIESGDRRGAVNALSNAKRALGCQIDSLMIAFGLGKLAKKWDLPVKIKALVDIGIVAPPILSKINRHRNEMEHEYSCPPIGVVGDFVDVVALFIEATKFHINDRRYIWEFGDGGQGVRLQLNEGHIQVRLDRNPRECQDIPAGSEEFFRLLRAISRQTEWETSGVTSSC
jgi:hypothetical protein